MQDRWRHGPEACLGRVGQDAPTPVLPCAQDSAHEQGAIELTWTYLQRVLHRLPLP
ncbi:Uncharacterised protein [Stenotrophomonas maltophilia]|nr:Uncharacterised protein [Stenotrophomonas maltophilia]